MPVVEDGRYVGLLSLRDIAQRRMTEVTDETDALRCYITGA